MEDRLSTSQGCLATFSQPSTWPPRLTIAITVCSIRTRLHRMDCHPRCSLRLRSPALGSHPFFAKRHFVVPVRIGCLGVWRRDLPDRGALRRQSGREGPRLTEKHIEQVLPTSAGWSLQQLP